jgi:hypothetical protein
MGDVHGIGGRGNGRPSRGAHEIAHEAGECALLLAAARMPLLCSVALIAVPVAARALGARGRGIHLPGECCERGRLAEGGRFVVFGGLIGVVRVGMLWGRGSTWRRGTTRSVQSLLDNRCVEGRANRSESQR